MPVDVQNEQEIRGLTHREYYSFQTRFGPKFETFPEGGRGGGACYLRFQSASTPAYPPEAPPILNFPGLGVLILIYGHPRGYILPSLESAGYQRRSATTLAVLHNLARFRSYLASMDHLEYSWPMQ